MCYSNLFSVNLPAEFIAGSYFTPPYIINGRYRSVFLLARLLGLCNNYFCGIGNAALDDTAVVRRHSCATTISQRRHVVWDRFLAADGKFPLVSRPLLSVGDHDSHSRRQVQQVVVPSGNEEECPL
jgi:hypothetical protein